MFNYNVKEIAKQVQAEDHKEKVIKILADKVMGEIYHGCSGLPDVFMSDDKYYRKSVFRYEPIEITKEEYDRDQLEYEIYKKVSLKIAKGIYDRDER